MGDQDKDLVTRKRVLARAHIEYPKTGSYNDDSTPKTPNNKMIVCEQNTGGRTRTDTGKTLPDFESSASTNFATPAN